MVLLFCLWSCFDLIYVEVVGYEKICDVGVLWVLCIVVVVGLLVVGGNCVEIFFYGFVVCIVE